MKTLSRTGKRSARRAFLNATGVFCMLFACLHVSFAGRLNISNYYSHRNSERPVRPHTEYIILHTTESPSRSALPKLRRNGEAHYFVDRNGKVYRIIHKYKVAFHAGRSMWNGRRNLDNWAIGIEIEGYHNKDITSAQYSAVREVVSQLQKIYGIADDHVLTHSMIAYGVPNRWHKKSHRGRKRCAMLFARRSVRLKLGLTDQPAYDPDVRAGRLTVGDPYLASVLYGNANEQELAATRFAEHEVNVIGRGRSAWDIARDQYNSPDTSYIFPDGRVLRGDQIKRWKSIPAGTMVAVGNECDENPGGDIRELGVNGSTAIAVAGSEYNLASTIYFLPDKSFKRGNEMKSSEFSRLPEGTKVLVGYIYGGYVTATRTPAEVCGRQWNFPSTFYRFPDGSLKRGNTIDDSAIPKGTLVFFRD